MTQYFKNVQGFEDLKDQFRALAKANHPDAGGDPEIMKEINTEFDQLFSIWKHRHNMTASVQSNETADGVRRDFYTEHGWAGSNYSASRSTKEICQIIRAYVKEEYPTYKFSVRFKTASMCSEIYVSMVNSPIEIYKTYEELTQEECFKVWQTAERNLCVESFGCLDDEHKEILKKAYEEHTFLKKYNEATQAVIDDVDRLVNSYRMEDCDSMIDYFDVSDYYFGCMISDKFAVVPKTTRIKNRKNDVAETADDGQTVQELPENVTAEEYEIQKTEHTKTHETIWTVKVIRKLDCNEYIKMAEFMKSIGGYYSRFVHAFVFKEDPSSKLKVA